MCINSVLWWVMDNFSHGEKKTLGMANCIVKYLDQWWSWVRAAHCGCLCVHAYTRGVPCSAPLYM